MKTFHLNISTPNDSFFEGDAEAVTLHSKSGSLTVLAGHQPMVIAVSAGEISVKLDGKWKSFISTGGFAEVTGEKLVFFTTAAEWEDDTAQGLSQREKMEAVEALRHKKSVFDHVHTKIEITRALSRLGRNKSNEL